MLPRSQMSKLDGPPAKSVEVNLNDLSNVDLTLMTLRKPTALKRVIDSIPMPTKAVPRNGLPMWYRLGLQCKLPVPKIPTGKIVFSRGRIGEDIIGVGLGPDAPRPSFDLTDPYCNEISYNYDSMHDRHMIHHYNQKSSRKRMKELGFCTDDCRAVCSLKEFNEYRKYLYVRFTDRIHMEMMKIDERARDDTTLKSVQIEIARQAVAFQKAERVREMQEKHERIHAEELAEKRRLAKELELKTEIRMKNLQEYNEAKRKKRIEMAADHKMKLKQRIQAAQELELRRKINMVRQWRVNEKRRVARLKLEAETKKAMLDKQASDTWNARVAAQNYKIQEEQILLKLYQDDMTAAANRRNKKAEIYAYHTHLALQRLKLENFKLLRGAEKKQRALVRQMGTTFGKSKRGAKGMSMEKAHRMAREAMSAAMSNKDDPFVNLGVARTLMEKEIILPVPPLKIIDLLLEGVVLEFARRHVHVMLKHVERDTRNRAEKIFFKNFRPSDGSKRSQGSRWLAGQLNAALSRIDDGDGGDSNEINEKHREIALAFGDIYHIQPEDFAETAMKSARDRTPTPVPSMTRLAEVTFSDKVEDLAVPSTHGTGLAERRKLLEMVHLSHRLLTRSTLARVEAGMDNVLGNVTLPYMKHPMEWGEVVEAMANAVVDNRIHAESPDLRQATLFLTNRILKSLLLQMKQEKKIMKLINKGVISPEEGMQQQKDFYDPSEKQGDFYVPGQAPTSSSSKK